MRSADKTERPLKDFRKQNAEILLIMKKEKMIQRAWGLFKDLNCPLQVKAHHFNESTTKTKNPFVTNYF